MHKINKLDINWRNNLSPDINAANLQLHTDKTNEVIEGLEELELEFAELPSIQDLNKTVEEVKAVDANVNKNALKAEGFAVGEQNGAEVDKNSEYYHNNAKWYSELAMSGTPEGYEQLVQEVDNIKRESSVFYGYGTNLNLVTEAGGIRLGSILGKSLVEGGEIKSVETINIINHNKNFIPYPYISQRKDHQDGHFEVLPTGGIHIWGEFKSDVSFDFATNFKLKAGKYVISGVPKDAKVMMRVINTRGQNWAQIADGGIAKKTITEDVEIGKVQIFIQTSGVVIDSIVYPQIEAGDTPTSFEPQISNPLSIAVPGGLRSVNDVADRLILSDDGKWIIERYTKKEIYNGQTITTDWISSTGSLTEGATVVYVTDKTEEILPDQEDAYRLLSFNDKTYIGTDEGMATFNVEFGKSVGVALGLRGDNAFGLADQKQSRLNDSQMAAVDSGITSTKVSSYDKAVSDVEIINTNLSRLSDDVDELSEETTNIKSDLSQYNAIGRTLELDTEVGGIVVNEIIGNSEQGANPSPTNPQPIKSSGDDGGISIVEHGKNFIVTPSDNVTAQSVTLTPINGMVAFNGKASGAGSSYFYSGNGIKSIPVKVGDKYTLSLSVVDGSATLASNTIFFATYFQDATGTNGVRLGQSNMKTNVVKGDMFSFTFEITQEMVIDGLMYFNFAIYKRANDTFNNLICGVQLEKTDTVTDFEPYTNKSIFIPITEPPRSVGNVHDRIIKKDGKWVVERRIKNIASYNGETITTAYMSTTGQLTNGAEVNYVLNTPTYEEITDQTALYLLESYADKTYISTSDGLAELNVNYGKSDAISLGLMGYNAFRLAENQLA